MPTASVDQPPPEVAPRWAPNPFALAEVALDRRLAARDAGDVAAALYAVFGMETADVLRMDPDSLLGVLSRTQARPNKRNTVAEALLDIAVQQHPSRELERYAGMAGPARAALADALGLMFGSGLDATQPLGRALQFYAGDERRLPMLARMLPFLLGVPLDEAGPGAGETLPRLTQIDRRDVHRADGTDLPIVGDTSYADPVQGLTWDCWLIAGLIAFAWTYPQRWKAHVEACCQPAGGAYLWTAFAEGVPQPERIALKPVFLAAKLLSGVQYPIGVTSTDRDEDWPSLAEKLFVYLKRREVSNGSGEPKHADYLRIQNLFPGNELPKLFAVKVNRFSPDFWRTTLLANAAGKLHATPEATVTWTVDDSQAVGAPRLGLAPNHAYAVLGHFVADGKKYLVLRDPYGSYTDGSRQPQPLPAISDDRGRRVQLGRNGVFACPADDFSNATFEKVNAFPLL